MSMKGRRLIAITTIFALFNCESLEQKAKYRNSGNEKSDVASAIDIPPEDPLEEEKERLRQSSDNVTNVVQVIFSKNLSESDSLQLMQFMINYVNRDIVKKTDINGWTLLHYATMCNWLRMVQLLIQNGADVNAKEKNLEQTPLHFIIFAIGNFLRDSASRNKDNTEAYIPKLIQTLSLLINAGADVNAQDRNGKTPLHHAVERGCFALVQQLLVYSSNPNLQDEKGRTPLHYAVFNNDLQIINLLRGCDLDGCRLLVGDYGTDVTIKDNQGLTAEQYANRMIAEYINPSCS